MNIWTKLAMFSFFETDRLYLRPFFFSDSQDFHEIASNPENLQFIFPTQASLEESQYALANYPSLPTSKMKQVKRLPLRLDSV